MVGIIEIEVLMQQPNSNLTGLSQNLTGLGDLLGLINHLAYLYLTNKTFINAHILKEELAEVDDSIDF